MRGSELDKTEDTILVTDNLRKYFGEVHAVDNINLSVRRGELYSIIGPNGSGKTTLINLISGLIEPDSGKVFFKGHDVTNANPDKLSKMGLMRSFQIVNIFDGLSVLDNVRIPCSCRLGRIHNPYKKLEDDKELKTEAEGILSLFGLLDKADILAQQLPHGDRKLLDVAICFAMQPEMVLLDEPTSGVSTSEKKKIMEQIISAVRKGEKTALIVEHDMDVVFSYSDRVVAMNRGKILAEGTPEEIKSNQEVRTAITGEIK
jgi:branched-chain amino acid transport system ATP-binding protein